MKPVREQGRPLRIFLSYRRDDAGGHAGRLYDLLAARYGDEHVFMDVDAIPLGTDFAAAIGRAVASCDVLIALIGRDWLGAADPAGRRRLDDPGDYVRIEIESALAADVVVVPTCVQGAEIPRPEELPPSLRPLTERQGTELTDAGWRDDVARLVRRLEPPEPASRRPRLGRRAAAAILVGALALGGGAAALLALGDGDDEPPPTGEQATAPSGPPRERLLAAIPAGTRPDCMSVSDPPPTAQASLGCGVAQILTAEYYLFADAAAVDVWYHQKRIPEGIDADSGGCTADAYRGEAAYRVDGRERGRWFCLYDGERFATLFAADPETRVGVQAGVYDTRGDKGAENLLELWDCCIRPQP